MVGCPTCGAELTFIEPYGRHYCYGCRSYAPRTLHPCPDCARALVFVSQHKRHYCYGCQGYKEDPGVRNPCPTCGGELEYLPQYERLYCYDCQRYAPRSYGLTSGKRRSRTVTPAPVDGGEAIGYTPFSREELDLASKEQLIGWCREYGLADTGMKYELRLRLLEHVRKQGLLLRGEELSEEPPAEVPASAEAEVPLTEGGEPPIQDEAPPPDERGEAEPEEEPSPEARRQDEAPSAPASAAEVVQQSPSTACRQCGGELTYIPQYGRSYCYHCRTYAPPAGGPTPAYATRAIQGAASTGVDIPRSQGNPLAGIYLAVVGLLLFVGHMLLYRAPGVFDLPVLLTAPEIEFALEFLSILFIASGLIASVLLVRRPG